MSKKRTDAEKYRDKSAAVQAQLALRSVQIIVNHRADAVQRLLAALFERDEVAKLFRLRGLGGATGVLTDDDLNKAANEAVLSGVIAQQPGDGASDSSS